MKRAEIKEGLDGALMYLCAAGRPASDPMLHALRSAIALLTVPTTEEIEAAREAIGPMVREASYGKMDRQADTLDRALDALARESSR